MKKKIYNLAVNRTLHFYENYILPQNNKRISLLEMKRAEFRERKLLLNPIMSQSLIEAATDEEKVRL